MDIDCYVLEVFPRVPEAFNKQKLGTYVIKKTIKNSVGGDKSIALDCGQWGIAAQYDKHSNSVKLRKGVCVDVWQGHLVGTCLMDQIICWARKHDGAIFAPIHLVRHQADDENRARRNRFYERYGFKFEFGDSIDREGYSRPIPVSELRELGSWQGNIRFTDIKTYVAREVERVRALETDVSCLRDSVQFFREENRKLIEMPLWRVFLERIRCWLPF